MKISNEQFDQYVEEAFLTLPAAAKDKLNNVAILVDEEPTPEQLKKLKISNQFSLFGLFEGHAQSRRLNFGAVLPDKITLFRRAIMEQCDSEAEIKEQIVSTLRHEIAHHFGSDEPGARRAGRRK